jgi:hypothetical protein
MTAAATRRVQMLGADESPTAAYAAYAAENGTRRRAAAASSERRRWALIVGAWSVGGHR